MINELTLSNYYFYMQNNLPILTIVVDSIYKTDESVQYLKFFEQKIALVNFYLKLFLQEF